MTPPANNLNKASKRSKNGNSPVPASNKNTFPLFSLSIPNPLPFNPVTVKV